MRLAALLLLASSLPTAESSVSGGLSTSFISPRKDVDFFILDEPTGCKDGTRKDGRAVLSADFANKLLAQAGYAQEPLQEDIVIQTSILSGTSTVHKDAYYNPDGTKTPVNAKTPVALITINDNKDASFRHGDKEVPIIEDQLVQFDGSVEHNTAVQSGVVMMLGPFELPSFNMVGRALIPSCSQRDPDECCSGNNRCALCPTTGQASSGKSSGKGSKSSKSSKGCNLQCVENIPSGMSGCAQCVAAPRRYLSAEQNPFQRRLEEMTSNEDLSLVIYETGGDPQGSFHEIEDMLPQEQCEVLKDYVDGIQNQDIENDNDYYDFFPVEKFVDLIGVENIKNLLQFFYDAVGSKMPISNVQVRRTYMTKEDPQIIPYHISKSYENRSTMAIVLDNEEDCQGGELLFLNENGVTPSKRVAGKAIVNGPEVIHGIASHTGTRYSLFLVGKPGAECVFRDVI